MDEVGCAGGIAPDQRRRDELGPCRRAIPCFEPGEGGATPVGRPAPRGAGSRPRVIEGVVPVTCQYAFWPGRPEC